MQWKMGKIVSLKVKSDVGGNLRLRINTPLKRGDGTALALASGTNSNPLMQPYDMPDAIVADESKIPETMLPTTYLYDIPTTAGEVIELVSQDATSAIAHVARTQTESAAPAYTIDGMRAASNYKGIVIKGGSKFVRR